MKNILFLLVFVFFASCFSSFKNTSNEISISKNVKVIVLPFINNSEEPMAGMKAKNILENYLISKKLNISLNDSDVDLFDNITEKDLKNMISIAKTKEFNYVFYGYVNEWRYKTGIDSEPSVSLTINLYDLKNDKIVWSSSGSKTMSSYKSTSIVGQKLIKTLLSDIIIK